MTPFGHLSTAYIISPKKKPFLMATLIGSVIMDADLIVYPLGIYNQIHRVVTHNLFFMFILCSLFLVIFWKKPYRWMVFGGLALGMASHILIDSMLDDNPTNGIGIALFWPFSQVMFSPVNFDLYLPYNWYGIDFHSGINNLIRSMLFEIPFIILAFILFCIQNYRRIMTKIKTKKRLLYDV